MKKNLPLKLDREILLQLSPEQLVDIIIEQAIATEKLNKRILELEQQVQKLRVSRDLDSKISSKPPSIEIVEYHRYTCVCCECGNSQRADWSRDLVPGQDIGIRLQAFLGWINNYGHLSYEKQQELLWELGQVEIGVGTLVTTNTRVDAAVAQSVRELKDWIQQTQPKIHADETPWTVKGVKEWLWIFANTQLALFHAADTRSRQELETILGLNYSGVLSSDDYCVYNGYEVKAQQKCLAHLRRHFKKLIKLPGLNNEKIGKNFVQIIEVAIAYSAFLLRAAIVGVNRAY